MSDISEYLLRDCHSSALVSSDGSVDWWSPSRFDAPSVFTEVLDPSAGHWSIRPTGRYEVHREYVDGTIVVQTEFRSEQGVLRLTDGLALGSGERRHDGSASTHVLVRHVQALEGEVEVAVELVARPEYGLIAPPARSPWA